MPRKGQLDLAIQKLELEIEEKEREMDAQKGLVEGMVLAVELMKKAKNEKQVSLNNL